jgi:hypothetical protein
MQASKDLELGIYNLRCHPLLNLFLLIAPQAADIALNPALTGGIGALACKFGVQVLYDTLNSTLGTIAAQSPETLANLPALADALVQLPPAALQVRLVVGLRVIAF